TMRAVVDLPEPDSPTRPKVAPRRTSKETPLTATVDGPRPNSPRPARNDLRRSRTWRKAVTAPPSRPVGTGGVPGRRGTPAGPARGRRGRRTRSGARTGRPTGAR